MKREIKFSLVFRDMWQSAGKYVPTVDQLTRVAPAIIEMGCFARVETNGGGFEQVNLLFGENPNKAVREWTKPFHAAGIQTHMLDRALNGLRMSPVPDDVRQLFYKVKKAQGTDIARTFCGLNDVRNIAPSIKYAKEAGMISQCSLCITHSPVHTVEYYTKMAFELIELGADEICIKDMAGIGRPYTLGRIVANIKEKYPEIPIQYHSHAGPGFNVASIMEVCNAGCDYIDVGMEPLSWGTGHADLLTVQAMLKDAGYKVPEINMEAYMKVRALVQEFMDDFLGLYISPKNRLMNSLLIGPGLPGGMMGSLMADLEKNLETINKSNIKNNKPLMSQDQLLKKLLFLGSTCIYPRDAEQPMKEDVLLTSPLEYTNEPYAIAKIAGLKMCESFNLQYGTNYIAVMPTNLYGPNDNFDLERSHVLPAMIRKIHLAHCLKEGNWEAVRKDMNLRPVEGVNGDSSKEDILAILKKYGISETEVTLWGTGTPLREFLWSEEMADASVFVMEHVDFKDTYKEGSKDIRNCHINIGTGKEITIRQLAERIVETVGYQGKLTFDSSKPDGTMRKLTDPSKLHALGWHHKIEIEEGVQRMYEWYLK